MKYKQFRTWCRRVCVAVSWSYQRKHKTLVWVMNCVFLRSVTGPWLVLLVIDFIGFASVYKNDAWLSEVGIISAM